MTRSDVYSMTVRLDGAVYVFEPDGRGWRHPEIGYVADAVEAYTACLAYVEEAS